MICALDTDLRASGNVGKPAGAPGFSLIELMIVLAVASILYYVAVPAYRQVLIKSQRAIGRGVLLDVLSREAQFFLNHKRYAMVLSELGLPDLYHVNGSAGAVSADKAIYRIELDLVSSAYVGARAIPVNVQTHDDDCHTLFISSLGVRGATGRFSLQPMRCW